MKRSLKSIFTNKTLLTLFVPVIGLSLDKCSVFNDNEFLNFTYCYYYVATKFDPTPNLENKKRTLEKIINQYCSEDFKNSYLCIRERKEALLNALVKSDLEEDDVKRIVPTLFDTYKQLAERDTEVAEAYAWAALEIIRERVFEIFNNTVRELAKRDIWAAKFYVWTTPEIVKAGVFGTFNNTVKELAERDIEVAAVYIWSVSEMVRAGVFEEFSITVKELAKKDAWVAKIYAQAAPEMIRARVFNELYKAIKKYYDFFIENPELGVYISKDAEAVRYLAETRDPTRLAINKVLFRAKVKKAFGIDVKLEDGIEYLRKYLMEIENKTGLRLREYTIAEMLNIIRGYMSLDNIGRKILVNLLRILPKYWEDPEIKRILQDMKEAGINIEALKPRVLKVYPMKSDMINVKYEDLVKALVYVTIGSRNSENIKKGYEMLSKVVGENKVRSIQGFYRSLPKEYKLNPKEIMKLLREGKYDEVLSKYKELSEKLENNGYREKKGLEFLLDTINTIEGVKKYGSASGKYVVAFIDRNPSMMFSYQSTGSCSELPDGLHKLGTVLYKLDPRVLEIGFAVIDKPVDDPIRYVRETRGEIDGKVISYIARTPEGEKVWIIDSVEMGPRLFFPKTNKWFDVNWDKVYNLILDVAKQLDVDYVVFNTRTYNTAPRYFLRKIEEKYGLEEKEIETKIIGRKKIPYDVYSDGIHYLEAYRGWNVPEGIVRGYIVPVTYRAQNKYWTRIKI